MKTVLVTEDNPANRELVTEMLTAAGFDVMEAADGLEALDLLAVRRPDFVLLDLQMPKLDGREALSRIRQNPDWSDLPVIACTAFAMQGEREKLLDSGFDGYLSKPFSVADLLKIIR